MIHIFHYFSLHLSMNRLLWKHLIEPSIPPTYSSCFIFLGKCFCFCVNGRSSTSTSTHPSNRVFFFLLTSLGSSLPVRARSRLTGRSRACPFPFRFQICFCFARQGRLFCKRKLATGFDLALFRKNSIHSSPRPRCLG